MTQALALPPVENTLRQWDEWCKSPGKYFEDVFKNAKCYPKQVEIAESVRDNVETYVPSCHGVGKTFIAARIALWFSNCFVPSIVITTAPTAIQVKKLLWGEIHKHVNVSDAFKNAKINDTYLEWSEDHYMIGRTAKLETAEHDQGVRFQGFHAPYILFILDEGPGVPQKIWDAIEGGMTSAFCRKLAIGNPTAASGPFFEACRSNLGKVIKLNIFHSPNFIANGIKCVEDLEKMVNWTTKDFDKLNIASPELTTPQWAVGRLKKWGKDSVLFKSRVIGEFPEQGVDELISLAWCEKCVDPEWTKTRPTNKVLAIDVARFGSDDTCFYGMEHYKEIYKLKYNGHDLMQTANRALNLIKEYGYDSVVVDADGVGAGVADKLRESIGITGIQCAVHDYHGGHKPSDSESFTNARSENWWNIRDLIRDENVSIKDTDDLFYQLTNIKYKYDATGRIRLETKDEMKKRGINSPDEADALVMCIWGLQRKALTDAGIENEANFVSLETSKNSVWDT